LYRRSGGVSVAEATSGIACTVWRVHTESKSKLAVSITAAGAKGSTISAYSTTLQGKAYGGASFTSDVLTAVRLRLTWLRLSRTAGAGRRQGPQRSRCWPIRRRRSPHFPHTELTDSGNADASGDYAAVRYAYSVPTLNGGNTAAMAVKYKRATSSDYNDTLLTGTALSADKTDKPTTVISSDYRWDLKITVTDYFGAASSATVQLPSGEVILDVKADGSGIGIGKTAEEAGLDVSAGWPAKFRGGMTIGGVSLLDFCHPVGSIYESTVNTDPGTLFGGTWVAWGQGRVSVGVDTSQSEFDTVEKTGGDKNLQEHTHGNRWNPVYPRGTSCLATNDLGGDAVMVTDNMPCGGHKQWLHCGRIDSRIAPVQAIHKTCNPTLPVINGNAPLKALRLLRGGLKIYIRRKAKHGTLYKDRRLRDFGGLGQAAGPLA
jgi:hypothetical protein